MIDWEKPTILESENLKLLPLSLDLKEDLLNAARDGELWKLWYTSVPSEETIDQYINTALQQFQDKTSLPFVIVNKATDSIIGSTRYCNIDSSNRRLEIGYTWYAKTFQRTGVNTACKYLLLQQAFEAYKVIAVEFKTHWFNYKSRNAIQRLGAKQDGVLRNHRIDKDGCIRDTVVFSIIQSEWKTVKKYLAFEMEKYLD
ncbi:MAG: GNAT family N-acetyltransferase [Saprospiraceae bacterium]|nr:GNAT family N-acetyltransferase [Saprospiraceae bacterium]